MIFNNPISDEELMLIIESSMKNRQEIYVIFNGRFLNARELNAQQCAE